MLSWGWFWRELLSFGSGDIACLLVVILCLLSQVIVPGSIPRSSPVGCAALSLALLSCCCLCCIISLCSFPSIFIPLLLDDVFFHGIFFTCSPCCLLIKGCTGSFHCTSDDALVWAASLHSPRYGVSFLFQLI